MVAHGERLRMVEYGIVPQGSYFEKLQAAGLFVLLHLICAITDRSTLQAARSPLARRNDLSAIHLPVRTWNERSLRAIDRGGMYVHDGRMGGESLVFDCVEIGESCSIEAG